MTPGVSALPVKNSEQRDKIGNNKRKGGGPARCRI